MKHYDSVLLAYRERIAAFTKKLQQINKKRTRIAWARFAVALLTVLIVIYSWQRAQAIVLMAEAVAGISIFLFMVSKDITAKAVAENLRRLIQINEAEISVVNGDYNSRDAGLRLQVPHPYANDIDIFGDYSVYQYLNRCTSEQGNRLIAARLLHPLTKNEIVLQQQAVKEIASAIDWRQQFQSAGLISSLTAAMQQRLTDWTNQELLYNHPAWRWTSIIFPAISLGTVALYVTDILPAAAFYASIFIFFLFAFSLSKKIHPVWQLLSRMVAEADTLQNQLLLIEQQHFSNEQYSSIRQTLISDRRTPASSAVKELKSILNRFDMRLNILVFYFLNTFLLWDLQQLLALNNWKKKNKANIDKWFNAIAQTEVTVSLSTLVFNQPHWCFPVIEDAHFTLHGTGIGHPLISREKRVDNDFGINGTGKAAIITGSNMGGKSTFLRSIGVNMVLAFMGAPVCAQSFAVSVVQLLSSMRITDNLAESTSTFYAELKKLQTIIQAVKQKEKIFILLDEILRGTNSLDRHTGSVALIKQLLQYDAVAIIATHDVALANLEKAYPDAIANYHFDVQVAGNDLYFDYRLKEGICQSMNASILMKNIGIEME